MTDLEDICTCRTVWRFRQGDWGVFQNWIEKDMAALELVSDAAFFDPPNLMRKIRLIWKKPGDTMEKEEIV